MGIEFGFSLRNMGLGTPPPGPIAHRDEILAVAEKADEAGADAVWVSDHIALPFQPTLPHPYSGKHFKPETPILDPIATLAVVAGRTKRVKLGFGVLVVPYRHPLVNAKLVATIDVFSGGRVILGVGTGWMTEEFEATGADYANRRHVTDEYIRYLREVWTNDRPEFQGRFFKISGLSVWPKPLQKPTIPIWVGGTAPSAMRRAAALGDAWEAIGVKPADLPARIAEFRRLCAEHGRDPAKVLIGIRGVPLDVRPRPDPSPDRQPFTGSPDQIVADARRYEVMGIGHILFGSGFPGWELRTTLQKIDDFAREVLPGIRGKEQGSRNMEHG